MMIELLGFSRIYSTNDNFKIFQESQGFYYINLELFIVDVKIKWRLDVFFFILNICFKTWVIANYKPSKYSASNNNLHELPVKKLLNPFKK